MTISLKNSQTKVPIPRGRILKVINKAMRMLRIESWDIAIVFVGPRRMRSVNKKYLKHDYVTDVLTFDLEGGMGEIIICPQMACVNAKRYQTSTEKEIVLYALHGVLHLAGFNDHTAKDTLKMRQMENKLLK